MINVFFMTLERFDKKKKKKVRNSLKLIRALRMIEKIHYNCVIFKKYI